VKSEKIKAKMNRIGKISTVKLKRKKKQQAKAKAE